jgi:hypothetical protein
VSALTHRNLELELEHSGERANAAENGLGSIQFDFTGLETKQLDLAIRQNSFQPDRVNDGGAMVAHLSLCLLVVLGNSCVQRPVIGAGRLNGN